MNCDFSSLKEIIEKAFSRYIRVFPNGFKLPHEDKIHLSLDVSLSYFHPARTLYQKKKPVCRSLDGYKPVKENRLCSSCLLQNQCTPQIGLEIIYQGIPLKLLLAYTSMRKFLKFIATLNFKNGSNDNKKITMNIINRGKWGEIAFKKKLINEKDKIINH